jgi:C_GCAxxG_C_C family probable redox protein
MQSKEIRKMVYHQYEKGFHCAEAIASTVLARFSDESHPEAIKIASGFGGGIAGSTRELCGAFTGGVIALSCLLGRELPVAGLKDFASVTNKFRQQFLDTFGELTCHQILERSKEQQNPNGCVKLTAQAAVMVCDLLNELEDRRQVVLNAKKALPVEMITAGQCPFGGCAC